MVNTDGGAGKPSPTDHAWLFRSHTVVKQVLSWGQNCKLQAWSPEEPLTSQFYLGQISTNLSTSLSSSMKQDGSRTALPGCLGTDPECTLLSTLSAGGQCMRSVGFFTFDSILTASLLVSILKMKYL